MYEKIKTRARRKSVVCLLGLSLFFSACASTDDVQGLDTYDEASTAHGAAFRVDAMHIRKPMQKRPVIPWKFYYKHCSENGDGSFYSKTSYSCTDRHY